MLHKARTLTDYELDSLDGEIGSVREFYFDDRHWTIRYLVADTGDWLAGRQVLISPHALVGVTAEELHIAVDLTKQQINDSPALGSDQPVSRQFEDDYYGYYGWPAYWGGAYAWGYSPAMVRERAQWKESNPREKAWAPNLYSTYDMSGHHVQATDGTIGHVENFIIDDETWAIRYLMVDTQNWWSGKKVLISPRWIERVVGVSRRCSSTCPARPSCMHRNTRKLLCSPETTKGNYIGTTSAKSNGSRNWLPDSVAILASENKIGRLPFGHCHCTNLETSTTKAMRLSSVSVVGNALRLKRARL